MLLYSPDLWATARLVNFPLSFLLISFMIPTLDPNSMRTDHAVKVHGPCLLLLVTVTRVTDTSHVTSWKHINKRCTPSVVL